MIPDCKKRLTAAVADLQNIVVSASSPCFFISAASLTLCAHKQDGLDAEAGATPEAEAAREALTAAAESETAA